MRDDTIFAVSSGLPPAAIAVLRISGAGALPAVRALAGPLPPPREARLRTLRHRQAGDVLDRCLVLIFPGPNSATGEDLVELHLHGGRAVIAAVEAALAAMAGLRRAEPGEFTRRALEAGRIDLAEAEGLGDLLNAQTERQRKAALAVADGLVGRAVGLWATSLLEIAAQVEAQLDFADEDDVEEAPVDAVLGSISALAAALASALATPPVERLHDGIRIVLAGPRNAGKSTLFNRLVDREAAIVSPIAGTTRDRIEAGVVRDGLALLFIDTAGIAEATDDPIEAIGIDRARAAVETADLILWLDEAPPPAGTPRSLWLWPRSDERPACDNPDRLTVSAHTGEGIEPLWSAIVAACADLLPAEDMLAFNARQRGHCLKAYDALMLAAGERDLLIIAEHLRLARQALDRITGASGVEAMLDALFGRFCIGK